MNAVVDPEWCKATAQTQFNCCRPTKHLPPLASPGPAFLVAIQARGEGPGNLWLCSLCPVKRDVEVGAKLKRGEHRRKDRTIDAGMCYAFRVAWALGLLDLL